MKKEAFTDVILVTASFLIGVVIFWLACFAIFSTFLYIAKIILG